MLEREKIVKATFFANSPKQLEFLVKALAKIVGKDNLNYLVPKFYHKSKLYILNADIKIPETLLRYGFNKDTGRSEEQ